jgi:hypothetical protein
MLYIAYGSNMNRRQMARRCPRARPLGPVRLEGWRLVMKRVADIEPDAQAVTPATLWQITRACERALDAYEGFPHLYTKERIAVALPNGRRAKPMAYVMNGPRQRDFCPASDGYLAAIADGYRDFGFDDLSPLRAAQLEAITIARRTERVAWQDSDTLPLSKSPGTGRSWAPGLAYGCE